MRLASYRDSYAPIVDRLAALVQTAEVDPVEPSPVPEISQLRSRFSPVFVVTVAAPALHEAPEGSDRLAYGAGGKAWRPFGHEQQPLAEYATIVAERFDFSVRVTDFAEAGDLLDRHPGVMPSIRGTSTMISGRRHCDRQPATYRAGYCQFSFLTSAEIAVARSWRTR